METPELSDEEKLKKEQDKRNQLELENIDGGH